MKKHRKVRSGSRWNQLPRNTPCQPEPLLSEREQLNRRIRRCRLSAEPSAAVLSTTSREPSDLLHSLQTYYETLRRDEDCYTAWIGLSRIFAALEDHERVRHCRNVALRLEPSAPDVAALPH